MKTAIRLIVVLGFVGIFAALVPGKSSDIGEPPLWRVYEDSLKKAKYVDLTHAITPSIIDDVNLVSAVPKMELCSWMLNKASASVSTLSGSKSGSV